MFDKQKLSNIIRKIKDNYESQEDFSKQSEISRTYLSQYMNMRLEEPPKPNFLLKLANASKGITNLRELLTICGYNFEETIINEYEKAQFLIDVNNAIMQASVFFSEAHATTDQINDVKNILSEQIPFQTKQLKLSYLITSFPEKYREDFIRAIDLTIDSIISAEEERKTYFDMANLKNNLKSNVFPTPTSNKLYMCPVYGRIAAGVPNWAEQCMEGRLPLDPDMMNIHNPEECFFLRVSGESMNKVVKNGGYALIRKQEDVENGDIAVVLVNGYDATLKKFTRKNDMVVLEPMSDDSSFEIQIYDRTTQIKILGKYIGKFELN